MSVHSSRTISSRDHQSSHGHARQSIARPSASTNLPRTINREITSAGSASKIIDIWRNQRDNFDYINFATAINRLSCYGISREQHRYMHQMADRLLANGAELLKECSSQEIANIVNGFAKLGIQNEELFTAIAGRWLADHANLLNKCNSQD